MKWNRFDIIAFRADDLRHWSLFATTNIIVHQKHFHTPPPPTTTTPNGMDRDTGGKHRKQYAHETRASKYIIK